jgi:hypothetical protein
VGHGQKKVGNHCSKGFVVLAEGLRLFRVGDTAIGGKVKPSGNLTFKKVLWMDVWELNQEGWDSFG